jgi:NAD(P)H-flavin reductase
VRDTLAGMDIGTLHVGTGASQTAMVPRPAMVRRVIRESADTVTLELDNPAGGSFQPGQFNMVYLFGVGEVALSISSDPANPQVLAHTVRAVGAVTTLMVNLKRGARVGVRGPYGSAWPVEEAMREGLDLLIVAGGIGIAPLRPVIYWALRERARVGRLIVLAGARRPGDLIYAREFDRWRSHRGVELHTIVDHGSASWRGPVGVITDLLATTKFDKDDTLAMVCGPEVMMRFVRNALIGRGLPQERIYLSLERNMKCAIGHCGHCQLLPFFVCKDGPVFTASKVAHLLETREL